jgi:hypothetical protein
VKIDRFRDGLREKMEDPDDADYIFVVVPGDLDPFDRHYGFSIHLDAELRLAGVGCCNGGGTLYSNVDFESDEEGDEIAHTMLDIPASDVDAARALIRLHMPELGCPPGTLIQYGDHEDRFDGRDWHLGEPRSIEEF